MSDQPMATRRVVMSGAIGAAMLGTGALGGQRIANPALAQAELHSGTVAFAAPGVRVLVADGDGQSLVTGSRVLRTATDRDRLLARERAWLSRAPGWARSDAWAGLATSSLLDLFMLTDGLPATVAGWSPQWRYIWPRDTAYAVAALAAVGHFSTARAGLEQLQRMQRDDGWFEARYRLDGEGPPDRRQPQLDGLGWALWGTAQVVRRLPGDQGHELVQRLRPMITRSVDTVVQELDNPASLPSPSPDYWEVAETSLTLGTVAPLAAGLAASAPLLALLGYTGRQQQAGVAHARLTRAIHAEFGPKGYPRHIGGRHRDAAVAFLLPPYDAAPSVGARRAFARAERELARPAGGLAPGANWKRDGISWTPETALFALGHAASGDRAGAQRWLTWLAQHRTRLGSLPEKVLYDGRPAAVAPLAWTASTVILTIEALQR